MKKPFVVGERVNVQGYSDKGKWHQGNGTITNQYLGYEAAVKMGDGRNTRVPTRCLRRLKKKVRREFWILESMIPHLDADVTTTKPDRTGYIHVREVLNDKA